MKKMLTLVLVLAVASLANAGLSISYDGTSTVAGTAITLTSDVGLVGGINNAIGIIVAPAIDGTLIGTITFRTVDAPVATPIVERMTGLVALENELPYGGGFANFVWGDPITTPAPAGYWLSFELAGYTLGTENNHTAQVDLLGENVTGGSIYLTAVPEPITMALLGLGGLFLRRRK